MLGEAGNHRADDRQIIDAGGQVRENLADRGAALAVPLELERRGQHLGWAVVRDELRRRMRHLDRLAIFLRQPRLRVERIDLRRPAVHVQEDDAPRLSSVMPWTRRKWSSRRRCRERPLWGSAQRFFAHQRRQRNGAEAVGAAEQHFAAVKWWWSAMTARHRVVLTQ